MPVNKMQEAKALQSRNGISHVEQTAMIQIRELEVRYRYSSSRWVFQRETCVSGH